MPTDRRALREAWEQDCNWTYEGDPDIGADAIDNIILRAYRAGQADRLEECIVATRDVCDMYDWYDERPFDAVIERLEALKGGSR